VITDEVISQITSSAVFLKHAIESNPQTFNEQMSYEYGTSRLTVINGILNALNYYPLFPDGMGTLKTMPWSIDPNIIWDFRDNSESLYASGIDWNIDYSDIYNKVILLANQTDSSTPLMSTLTFHDIDMDSYPLSAQSMGRTIIKKFDSEAATQDYLDLRAERELRKMLELEESLQYKHAYITSRDNDGIIHAGDFFRFTNSLLNIDQVIYRVESQSYELKPGSLVTSTIKKITSA
jgi:hypothetical protein